MLHRSLSVIATPGGVGLVDRDLFRGLNRAVYLDVHFVGCELWLWRRDVLSPPELPAAHTTSFGVASVDRPALRWSAQTRRFLLDWPPPGGVGSTARFYTASPPVDRHHDSYSKHGRGARIRTLGPRFWRPML